MRTAAEWLEQHNVVGMTNLMIPIINKARTEVILEVALIAFQYTDNEDTKKLTTELLELLKTIK